MALFMAGVVFAYALSAGTGGKNQLKAVETDSEKICGGINTGTGLETAAEYLARQGVNTVIFNTEEDKENTAEFLSRLKKALNKKKINLYVSVDCDGLGKNEIISEVKFLKENCKPDGVIINNLPETDILKDISNILKRTDLVLKTDDLNQMRKAANSALSVNFIAGNITAQECEDIKRETGAKVFLDCTFKSAKSEVFILSTLGHADGGVFGSYDKNDKQPLYLNTVFDLGGGLPSFGLKVSTDFNITYPTGDFSTYYGGIFITGTGEPFGTVWVNGQRYGAEKDGTFGIYYFLGEGDNVIEIKQGENSRIFTVTKKTAVLTGEKPELDFDDTVYLTNGRVVCAKDELTSLLSDPDDDYSIVAGIEKGTKLAVRETVETERNGHKTYAYKLSDGAYILAGKTEILPQVTADFEYDKKYDRDLDPDGLLPFEYPLISSRRIEKLSGGDEIIKLSVNNMPAVISELNTKSLTIHFLDTEIADIAMPSSRFYGDYRVYIKEDGTYIEFILNGEKSLWGYDVSVGESGAEIYLKSAPEASRQNLPLKDVVIMLDAGHGGKDSGALGVASVYGPLEKDVNLAVAKATKTLLEKCGAAVIMTRDDDSYLTLRERRGLIRNLKPDLFISVHHNSMSYSYNSSNATGSECYYFTDRSKKFAEIMCNEISGATGRVNRGAFKGNFYVTRTNIAPSVLMEYSFIINPRDYSSTYTDTDIYKAAFGTMQAVLKVIPQQ